MKKSLFFLLAALVICSCRGPMGPEGPQGPKGDGMNWKIVDLDITQWDYSNYTDNNYYFAKYEVPALTNFVFTDGNVNGYILLKENGETIQHSLPYVLHKYEIDGNGDPIYYTETIDFVYGVGWVQIEVRDSDFAYEGDASIVPNAMSFRVVMTY